jgi:hypothetical protein
LRVDDEAAAEVEEALGHGEEAPPEGHPRLRLRGAPRGRPCRRAGAGVAVGVGRDAPPDAAAVAAQPDGRGKW